MCDYLSEPEIVFWLSKATRVEDFEIVFCLSKATRVEYFEIVFWVSKATRVEYVENTPITSARRRRSALTDARRWNSSLRGIT